MKQSRRTFITKLSKGSAAAAVVSPLTFEALGNPTKIDPANFTFLFQGDSITDGNRTRNNDWNHILGHGYMYLIASRLWFDKTEAGYKFLNRGISGNKVTDLAKRWQTDTLDLKPNVLSILVGVNDAHSVVRDQNPESAALFEETYRKLLTDTKQSLHDVVLVLCEPFILPVGKVKNNVELWNEEIQKRQIVVKRLASEFQAIFVPFQKYFDEATEKAPADFWCWDGIHPMPVGHELMARVWIKEVSKKLKL
jgi:lysophospholipase L1-like esterase